MTDDDILARILRHEGGYVNHPLDKGGPTNWGITQATLGEWRGASATEDDVRRLTVEEAKEIYRERYIKPFALVPMDVKPQVVDIAVNSGVSAARALFAKANTQSERSVNTALVIERLRHYAKLVRARPERSAFIVGWTERAVSFL
jgi:lysozyme family protein